MCYRPKKRWDFWRAQVRTFFLMFNSHAGGKAVARPNGFEIDFVWNPIDWSEAWFFVIILKFIFTPIFEIKIHEKKSLTEKKNSFSKLDFYNLIHYLTKVNHPTL